MRFEHSFEINQPTKIEKVVFEGIELVVTPPVYAPREDSFLLAEAVSRLATGSVLDVGTGSGLQAIVAAKKSDVKGVTAVDASIDALKCARQNAERNSVAKKIKFLHSNLFEKVKGVFDTIVFNPPYLPVERNEKLDGESMAWHGGVTGRSVLDPFLNTFSSFLTGSGQLLLLQSSLNSQQKTTRKLKQLGFSCEAVSTQSFFFEKIQVVKAIRE